jgi:hypothetical protein
MRKNHSFGTAHKLSLNPRDCNRLHFRLLKPFSALTNLSGTALPAVDDACFP